MGDHYVMDAAGTVREEPDLLAWALWFEDADRHIGNDTVNGIQISTVFLGLDHGFPRDNEYPLVFETMLFGDEIDGEYQWRYRSIAAAREGHAKAVQMVRDGRLVEDPH